MTWIEPLDMETWIVQVFSGSTDIFTAIFIIAVSALAGYFKMPGVTYGMIFLIGIMMFKDWITPSVTIFVTIILSVLISYWTSKLVK